MKRILYNIGLLICAVILAVICYDVIVWIGISHTTVHVWIENYNIVLLSAVLYLALQILFVDLGSSRYDIPRNERIVRAPEGISLKDLSDANTYELLKDNKRKAIRQYKNKVSGESVITRYDKPKRLPGKNKGMRRAISIALIIVFIVGYRAIPRISKWNQLLCDYIGFSNRNAMSYFYDGDVPSSVKEYYHDLKDQLFEWVGEHSIINSDEDQDDDQYIFSDSDSRLLTEEDIEGMDSQAIQMAINEIYARRGYAFLNDKKAAKAARKYFLDKDWYTPTIESMEQVEKTFSEIERKNVDFLVKYR